MQRLLRRLVSDTIDAKERQGFEIGGVRDGLAEVDGLDALLGLAGRLQGLPMRPNWGYVEPEGLEAILGECDADRPSGQLASSQASVAERTSSAFIAAVCGCLLGKPIEVQASATELKAAADSAGEAWPPADYISTALLDVLGRRAPDWSSCVRGAITHVPPDDDINFRILAMLLLERHGAAFSKQQLVEAWTHALPIAWVWASNRTFMLKAALHWWRPGDAPLTDAPVDEWVGFLNPYDEDCGAVIRVDPYGYACPGRPEMAAALAWRDASVTHTRNGVYAAMFQAAAVAAALVLDDPIEIVEVALAFVPRRSRLRESLTTALTIVRGAPTWEIAYRQLEDELGQFGHCQIHFELATVVNSLRFASTVGNGLGIQIAQGLDTDSFGACAGSLLGARFGARRLEATWTSPLNDDLQAAVAGFHERSLSAVAARMAELPWRLGDSSATQSVAGSGAN